MQRALTGGPCAQLTAHSAFKSTDDFLQASFDIFLELVACFACGQDLPNRVDLDQGY